MTVANEIAANRVIRRENGVRACMDAIDALPKDLNAKEAASLMAEIMLKVSPLLDERGLLEDAYIEFNAANAGSPI